MKRDDIAGPVRVNDSIEWEAATGLTDYALAVAQMEQRAADISAHRVRELVWLVEHAPLYTAGTSAKDADLIDAGRFPVFKTGRGGQFTYHGPGQRVGYVMLDLRKRGGDVRAFVAGLEQWLINTLASFGIRGERREDRVGVWVARGDREDKVAALGIRVRGGVSFHGVSLNVNPDLSHFSGIVPCGVTQHGVTSLHDLGLKLEMTEVDEVMRREFEALFGPVVAVA